jgi:hypothetical protein
VSLLPYSPHRLCEARFTTVSADIDLREVRISATTGDFTASSLAHIINTQTVNDLIVKSWLDLACTCLGCDTIYGLNQLLSSQPQIDIGILRELGSRP